MKTRLSHTTLSHSSSPTPTSSEIFLFTHHFSTSRTKSLVCTFGYRRSSKYRLIGHARVQVESLAQGPPSASARKYRVGPIADNQYWFGGEEPDVSDRGHWSDMTNSMQATCHLALRQAEYQAASAASFDPSFSSLLRRSKLHGLPELRQLPHHCISTVPFGTGNSVSLLHCKAQLLFRVLWPRCPSRDRL
ncbi:uncharacterized protein ARMOST_16634 [Armillaria ostoyae]|uniref:Uncharacterized protein n=1 Tax=Armillaria ostoyae TaxID=47428 RepID=A0A284RWS2_ARMOS|nr:uncharacterized protein ARMOST_16634 [Armillaria ostoyae]